MGDVLAAFGIGTGVIVSLLIWNLKLTSSMRSQLTKLQMAIFGDSEPPAESIFPVVRSLEELNRRVKRLEGQKQAEINSRLRAVEDRLVALEKERVDERV